MTTSVDSVLKDLKEELEEIKAIIITEEKLIKILREELSTQENKYKNGIEKLQRQMLHKGKCINKSTIQEIIGFVVNEIFQKSIDNLFQ